MTIHLSKAEVTEAEEEHVLAALRSGWIAPLGPQVDAFEAAIANRVGVRHALALSSGTAALHLALLELGAAPGKFVVLPTLTFAATANAVLYTGATPVFVDCSASDGNVDPGLLIGETRALLDEGKDVTAVITVDLFGRAADYSVICPELELLGVPLLEDAAEALGASHAGQSAGSFGRAAALSFNGNKILTTSGGGMLLSNDEDLIKHARKLSTQAREDVPWYEHTEVGYNYRLSNILAALGLGQLERLDAMIARRRQIYERYRQNLSKHPSISFLGDGLPNSGVSNHWLTCIRFSDLPCGGDVLPLLQHLWSKGIEARHVWKPLHAQPLFKGSRARVTGEADRLFRTGVVLPSGSSLSDADIDTVSSELLSVTGPEA